MVAAAKLRRSQDRIIQMRPFSQKLTEVLRSVSAAGDDGADWYNTIREEKKILIVTVSADRGLCGSFNTSIFKATIKLIKERYSRQHEQGNVTILPIGKKAFEYFKKRGYKVEEGYWNLFQDISFDNVSRAAEHMMSAYKNGRYDKIDIVYNEFKNVATQILRVEAYLPIVPADTEAKIAEVDYIYQPDREEIVTGLIPKSLRVQLL